MSNHDSNESANQEAWELGMSKSAIRKAKKKAANETYATVVQGVVQPSGGVVVIGSTRKGVGPRGEEEEVPSVLLERDKNNQYGALNEDNDQSSEDDEEMERAKQQSLAELNSPRPDVFTTQVVQEMLDEQQATMQSTLHLQRSEDREMRRSDNQRFADRMVRAEERHASLDHTVNVRFDSMMETLAGFNQTIVHMNQSMAQ